MKISLYEASRSVYGKESSNMQPVAFGYVPARKRDVTAKAKETVSHVKPNRSALYSGQAIQNG